MRNITPALELIKAKENFESHPYLCPAKIPSIGYGTIVYPDGKKVTLSDPPISKEYATECLRFHVKKDCDALEKFLSSHKIKLTDNQFSALISFSYNCGIAPVITPGKTIAEGLIHGSKKVVVDGIMLYTRATINGKRVVLNGLKARRTAESKLYLS